MSAAARLILAFAALAVAAPAATAAPLSIKVVNGRGTEQASLAQLMSAACPAGCTRFTDGHGRLAFDVAPGDRVAVTRGGAVAEASYTVPAVVPGAPVTLTVPALLAPVTPALNADERWLLDRVNLERAQVGRSALQRSGTLDRTADAYAHYLLSTGQFSHTALADPPTRAVDQGWPVVGGVGETLALAPSKEHALSLWRGSPPHWTLLMMDGLTAAGVGRAGNRWVMVPGSCTPTDAPERCELGVGAVEPPPPAAPAPKPTVERRARLRVRLRHAGRRLTVLVRLVEGRGKLRVAVRQGGRRARLNGRRHGAVYRAVTTLPRGGRWRVAIRFKGASGWGSRRLATRTVRVR